MIDRSCLDQQDPEGKSRLLLVRMRPHVTESAAQMHGPPLRQVIWRYPAAVAPLEIPHESRAPVVGDQDYAVGVIAEGRFHARLGMALTREHTFDRPRPDYLGHCAAWELRRHRPLQRFLAHALAQASPDDDRTCCCGNTMQDDPLLSRIGPTFTPSRGLRLCPSMAFNKINTFRLCCPWRTQRTYPAWR